MANHPLTRTRAPRRFLIWLAALIVATLAGATLAPPATAAGTGDDYPSYLKAGPIDSIIDPWNFYNRNCTSFAAWRLNQQAGRTTAPWAFTNNMTGPNGTAVHFGNAIEWRAAATSGGWSVNNTPAVGAVAWWGSSIGTLGHVAIVSAVNPDGSTNVEEYNWGSAGTFHTRTNVRAEAYLHIFDQGGGDRDGDGVTDANDRCPDQAGPASYGGCPGPLVAMDWVSTSAPSGWFVEAPITQSYTVKNVSGSAMSIKVLTLGLRDPWGSNYDQVCATGLTLQPGESKACTVTTGWGSVGTYRFWPAWQGYDDAWHSITAERTFALTLIPVVAVVPVTSTAPSGWFVGAPITQSYTVKNVSGSAMSIKVLTLGLRDPWGSNYDQACALGLTLQPGESKACTVTTGWGSVGTYRFWPTWQGYDDVWHDIAPQQTFALTLIPVVAVEPVRSTAPSGWFTQAPITQTYTVKNVSGSAMSIKALTLGMRDPAGTNVDQPCAAGLTLQPGQTQACTVTKSWPSAGTYKLWPAWLGYDDAWHTIAPDQTFTLAPATPVTAAGPARVDGCGSGKDTYTIPAVTGVEYLVAGTVKAAGSYPGTGTVTITARAKTGYVLTGTTTWTLSWTTTACTTTVTGNALSTPTWTLPKATLSWASTGAPAGTTLTYDVQYRAVTLSATGARGYTTPTPWLTATTTTTGTLTGTAGAVYQVHARATDQYGTVGAWSSWKTVTMPTDDRATSFGYTGTWTTGTSTSYYAGTYKLTSTPGAKVTVTAWTDQVALIGARSTTSGKATITIDGVLKATIDAYGATAAYRQTLATITVPYGEHTITVTNLATTGRPRLNLDALAFRR